LIAFAAEAFDGFDEENFCVSHGRVELKILVFGCRDGTCRRRRRERHRYCKTGNWS
jgi:hypothetical protein